MAFVNLSLLLGGLFVAIPVVVHLLMRREPRRQVFPAIQFLIQRRESNRQTLQIRHWVLLFLRCACIGVLAMALARPSVISSYSERGLLMLCGGSLAIMALGGLILAAVQRRNTTILVGLALLATVLVLFTGRQATLLWAAPGGATLGNQRAPVTAVFLFDTSPRLLYQYQNQSRLEQAQQEGLWLLKQLPSGSQVAVLETRPGPGIFAVDLAAAEKAIGRLQPSGITDSLAERLVTAIELVAGGSFERKEIYVLTDLTWQAWPDEATRQAAARLAQFKDIQVYLFDVGVDKPRNVALGDARLSAEHVPMHRPVQLDVEVSRTEAEIAATVELLLERPDPQLPILLDGQTELPELELRSQREFTAGLRHQVTFSIADLAVGTHHGQVRLRTADNLAVDDVRYFTVQVAPPHNVLLTSPTNANRDLLAEALAPREYRQLGQARFSITEVHWDEIATHDLQRYAAVGLLDPKPLSPLAWNALTEYVQAGGGLAVFLGRNAQPLPLNEERPYALLGVKLARQWRSADGDLFVAPASYEHPVLRPFRDLASSVPWSDLPIYRHWVLDAFSSDASVVMGFSNNRPALVENRLGRGRVLTLATPVSDSAIGAKTPWNELSTSETVWPYVVLMNETFNYLAQQADYPLNYRCGQTVNFPNRDENHPDRYQLFLPAGPPTDVRSRDGIVTLRFTEQAGSYRLKGFQGGSVQRGFSVNLPVAETSLERRSWDSLQEQLPRDQSHYARSRDEVELEVGEGRTGQEFYSVLIALLVLVVGLEQIFANRFYSETA